MKYLKQFLIILLFTCIGEIMHYFIPLPIPASVYGLVLLFLALALGILKVESVHDTSRFLIEIMPVMFIPAAVGLIQVWNKLAPILFPTIFIMSISTMVVMVFTGKTAMQFIKKKEAAHE